MKKEELLDDEIQSFLDSYVIEKVPEEQINETIEVLRAYVPTKKETTPLKSMFQLLKNEFRFITPLYWVMVAIVLVSGVGAILTREISPYIAMWSMAPVPALLGLMEILRENNERVVELEMSFKYSFREIILCRLFIIGVLSIITNIGLCLLIKNNFTSVTWGQVLISWVIPYTMITALGLLLATRIRNESVIIAISVVWIYFSVVSTGRITEWIENLKIIQSSIIIIIGLVFLGVSYIYFYKNKLHCIEDGTELV
ncbi:hypothetical protein [Oceanirhabdus seepicola]|uniref:Uncharacterized protein n=1 Tax=Oceanirhabdus seepicola TaxID=2828781 RepID=A0A9J6PAN2_9CLOT|nr:hypothetical protein [Oceanirhabdus seepicola]MCM1992248.1 hypothetical protein [Oceanirhabdus seepicola]